MSLGFSLGFFFSVLLAVLSKNSNLLFPRLLQGKSVFFHRIWAKDLTPSYRTGNVPIPFAAPISHKGILFQGGLGGEFFAFSLEDGSLLWMARAREAVTSSASVWKNLVIFGDISGRVYAHHAVTGKLAYTFDVGSSVEGKVKSVQQRGFIHTRNHSIVAFDLETGKILWSFKRNVPYTNTIQGVSNPTVFENYLIVGFADGYLVCLGIEDGRLVWEKRMSSRPKFVDIDVSPLLYKKALYVGSHGGKFMKLNPLTGDLIRSFDFKVNTPPLFTKEKMFVGTLSGDIRVFNSKGEFIKRVVLREKVPVTNIGLWKGFLVSGDTGGWLHQINPITLDKGESLHLGHEDSAIYGDMVFEKDFLGLISSRNRLYIFQ